MSADSILGITGSSEPEKTGEQSKYFYLAVWRSEVALSDKEAAKHYAAWADGKETPAEFDAAVYAFSTQLTSLYPDIDMVDENELENSPWASALDISSDHVVMALRSDRYAGAFPAILQLADQHGLVCYDPQNVKVHLPSRLDNRLQEPPSLPPDPAPPSTQVSNDAPSASPPAEAAPEKPLERGPIRGSGQARWNQSVAVGDRLNLLDEERVLYRSLAGDVILTTHRLRKSGDSGFTSILLEQICSVKHFKPRFGILSRFNVVKVASCGAVIWLPTSALAPASVSEFVAVLESAKNQRYLLQCGRLPSRQDAPQDSNDGNFTVESESAQSLSASA